MTRTYPFLHVAVDWDEIYVRGGPAYERREEVFDYADQLRARNVPTFWLFYRGKGGPGVFYKGEREWNPANTELRSQDFDNRLGLSGFAIKNDEDVYAKQHPSGFVSGELSRFIRTFYGDPALLITGGRTRLCVQSTLQGAALYGFDSFGVCDLMFDDPAMDKGGSLAHKKYLQKEWLDQKAEILQDRRQPKRGLITAQQALALSATPT